MTDDGGTATLVPDPGASMPGRGAWLHPDVACLDLAGRRRAFSRALRREVGGADAVRAYLEDLRGDPA